MGLLDDMSKFLETRLEEFIRNNPQIELQVLEEKLQQQDSDVTKLIAEFGLQEKKFQDQILAIAEDIKLWHGRAQKAAEAGRQDLANGAKEREAASLKQGNQVWAQMELVKNRRIQTIELQGQIQQRKKEIRAKIAELEKSRPKPEPPPAYSFNWENLNPPPSSSGSDELDQKFRQWEMDDELERLKRKMGK